VEMLDMFGLCAIAPTLVVNLHALRDPRALPRKRNTACHQTP